MSEAVVVCLKYVSSELWNRSDGKDGPNLPGGVRDHGPGWYWALVDRHGKTDDEWWFGPEPTRELARFVAKQAGYSVINPGSV
jgi:hypothetical protein